MPNFLLATAGSALTSELLLETLPVHKIQEVDWERALKPGVTEIVPVKSWVRVGTHHTYRDLVLHS